MKKLALFDLDGTLFNTTSVNFSAYEYALNEQGFSLDYEYFKKECNGRHFTEFIPKLVGDNKKLQDIIHERKKEVYSNFLDKATINFHLFNIAKSLKEEYYLAIVTTASVKNATEILNFFEVFTLFDLIITKEDVENFKPNPEGFLKAMEHFKVNPADTIIFEDSDVGIEAAMNTGSTVFKIKHF